MKKIFSIIGIILLISLTVGTGLFCICSYVLKTEEPYSPLVLINEVEDQNSNIIQQTFYNEETGDLWLKEYTYELCKNKWICTNQQTSIMKNSSSSEKAVNNTIDNSLKIFHNYEITNNTITVLDNELVNIALVGTYGKEAWYEFAYELKITNKTSSIITFTIDDASIMGINCKPLFTVDHIEPSKSTYFRVGWDVDTLTRNYIPYIDNVEFRVKIFNNEDLTGTALTGTRLLIKNN